MGVFFRLNIGGCGRFWRMVRSRAVFGSIRFEQFVQYKQSDNHHQIVRGATGHCYARIANLVNRGLPQGALI